MISAFVSRKDGLGLTLTQDELDEINRQRTCEQSPFKNYISEDSAIEILGTKKKKRLTNKHALIKYIDMGVNNEGFWDYHQMALQVEDAFDVLRVKYPEADFLILMDQSAGHGKKRV